MKPSTELFSLVQSLTKSEKRFFKLNSSLQAGDKNYLKLFDYIEKQSSYNEEELKKYFEKERFIQHLPSEKNHLYKLILKSLRSYYSDQSVKSQLKEEIKTYIIEASLLDANEVKDETMIFDEGLLDSMGLLFLIEFLKENFKVEVEDDELNPKNFESVNSIYSFCQRKIS